MRVFVTGATGFIGSAIVPELLAAGHQVLGLARSDASAAALAAAGAEVHRGTLDDPDGLARAAEGVDGVIHAGYNHDFFRKPGEDPAAAFMAAAATDRRVIEALGAALAGSGRPLVVTSGIGLLTPGRVATEDDAADPDSAGGPRVGSEVATLALADRGVRAMVLRLPPSVHGAGDQGFVPGLIGIARAQGASAYIGAGHNRWPAVHRLDAARLYRLALEQAPPGARIHAVADEGVPTRAIAEVIGRRLDLPVISKAPEEAADHFGWITHFFGLDIPASAALTRDRLGWRPDGPGLLADLDAPHYFAA